MDFHQWENMIDDSGLMKCPLLLRPKAGKFEPLVPERLKGHAIKSLNLHALIVFPSQLSSILYLMSSPSRRFEKLSIYTTMPTTRRQAQGRSSEKAPEPESSPSASDEDNSNEEQGASSRRSRPGFQASPSKGKQRRRHESPGSSTETSPSPTMSRAYKTRDLLSTFDADVLPTEFRPDIFERINHPRTPAECLKQLDLEGTIFQLAVNDGAVYKSLSKAQPVQARAAALFQKVSKHIRITLRAFDEYAENGTPPRVLPSPHPSVQDLGDRLQEFVDIIRNEVHERHPHGGERAAECVIFMLREVCNRNYDAFENNVWGRRAPRTEDADDRNLFQCLIGHPRAGSSPFALDVLKELPHAVLGTTARREQLDEIRGLLHHHQAPVAYRRVLQEILDPPTGASGPTGGLQLGNKRPAAGTGRGGQKRMK